MQLAEIGETIKELRPLGEACQEESNRIQLTLAEKRLNLQHLADNLREKYDVELGISSPLNPATIMPVARSTCCSTSKNCAAAWSVWAKSTSPPSASTKS